MAPPPTPARDDRTLHAALLLTVLFHGGLLLAGSYRRTYDAYIHIFFADHYARDWFSTWEPRWYTGFTTTSYPPGAHQAIALTSRLTGLELGFALVQLAALCLLVVGVYRFSKLWVTSAAAGWAALLAAVSSSVAEAVHTFGQLPTTLSLGFLLNAAPFARRWITDGRCRDLALATICLGATTAAHHVTTLFGSAFFLGPVILVALIERFRTAHPDETAGRPRHISLRDLWPLAARRLRRVLLPLLRAGGLMGVTAAALVAVVLPYWLWSASDPISQIPIPHASRASFVQDVNAGLVFWLVPWSGVLCLLLPALVRGFTNRCWPLAASVLALLVLGTGGTTPIPRLLLGGAFDILTLDRFTFWATIAVLPLVGHVVVSLHTGRLAIVVRQQLGRLALPALQVLAVGVLVGAAIFAAVLPSYRRFQPDPVDPGPIASFLEKDQHDRWRYLTLGLGDQMAWVSANTTATTVDGNYHSARRLPELVTAPVERLEGAKFRGVAGIGSLQQFLAVPSRYNLKFVFSNDQFYDPLLAFSGWHRLERLDNGVVVWERSDVPPLPTELPTREVPQWQRALWGTVPMTAMALAALGLALTGAGVRWRPLPGLGLPAAAVHRSLLLPRRILGSVDRRLAAAEARVRPGTDDARWQSWRRRIEGVERAMLRAPSPTRRRLQALGLLVAACALVLLLAPERDEKTPTEVVAAYHDDLDFRRFADAHQRLDPATRPSLEQFLLELSVADGLVASYGKLDRLDATVESVDRGRAVVRAELEHVTALEAYQSTVRHELVRRDGRWYLEPQAADLTVPPDQLVRRALVDFRSQGRRRVTAETTDSADIIDRPEVVTADARLVRVDGRWVVIGEVVNTDVDPADVTITAELTAADGSVLARYDAALLTMHELLPQERAPFRVDFEGIAGALDVSDPSAGEFEPGAATPLVIEDGAVAGFTVSTKAVVTDRIRDRALEVRDLRIEHGPAGSSLVGSVRNAGTVEVTVPRLLLTYRHEDGTVAWVENAFLDRAVRPQRSISVRVPLSGGRDVEATAVPGQIYDSLLWDLGRAWPAGTGLLPFADGDVVGLDVTVDGYERSVEA